MALAVDLANRKPATVEELVRRCTEAGLVITQPVRAEDLVRTIAMLRDWERIVDTVEERARADLVNRRLAAVAAYPRLSDHAGDGWHLHYRDDDASFITMLKAVIFVGTALHLAGRGMHRLGRCGLTGCDAVYADTSRGGTQRYCSPRCANRDAVRRHRARARPAPDASVRGG
ncbi:CGNR zinc finger domain-containing protein [Microbispora sp. NPDC088329]|uniref:CGNR zinc finger domain-containing protein n=1 Tax=Microbispora sp. NPDC088329 TaxID=3154869 RepID=UPI0034331AFB